MILHRFYFNLNQSDKKSDQPGILGPPRPLIKSVEISFQNSANNENNQFNLISGLFAKYSNTLSLLIFSMKIMYDFNRLVKPLFSSLMKQ